MNVLDFLKGNSVEDIKEYCKINAVEAAVAMTHINSDFNLSQLIRNANFFGFKEVFYIEGKKSIDIRGAVGANHYTDIKFCRDRADFWNQIKDKYIPVAIENNVNFPMKNIYEYSFPKNPIFIFGEEGLGLDDDMLSRCEDIVSIPACGSVRSVNVGSCSAVVMSMYNAHYSRKGVI